MPDVTYRGREERVTVDGLLLVRHRRTKLTPQQLRSFAEYESDLTIYEDGDEDALAADPADPEAANEQVARTERVASLGRTEGAPNASTP